MAASVHHENSLENSVILGWNRFLAISKLFLIDCPLISFFYLSSTRSRCEDLKYWKYIFNTISAGNHSIITVCILMVKWLVTTATTKTITTTTTTTTTTTNNNNNNNSLGFLNTDGSPNSGQRPDIVLINKKQKRTCQLVDFAVPFDHRVKIKRSQKTNKYLDLPRELEKNAVWRRRGY